MPCEQAPTTKRLGRGGDDVSEDAGLVTVSRGWASAAAVRGFAGEGDGSFGEENSRGVRGEVPAGATAGPRRKEHIARTTSGKHKERREAHLMGADTGSGTSKTGGHGVALSGDGVAMGQGMENMLFKMDSRLRSFGGREFAHGEFGAKGANFALGGGVSGLKFVDLGLDVVHGLSCSPYSGGHGA